MIEHVDIFVRKSLPLGLQYCITLAEHSSREDFECLELCKKKMVQSPSNTTHFLQLCDQNINNAFKEGIRMYQDLLHKQATLEMRSVRSNLMVAMLAYSDITVDKIELSFESRGYSQ